VNLGVQDVHDALDQPGEPNRAALQLADAPENSPGINGKTKVASGREDSVEAAAAGLNETVPKVLVPSRRGSKPLKRVNSLGEVEVCHVAAEGTDVIAPIRSWGPPNGWLGLLGKCPSEDVPIILPGVGFCEKPTVNRNGLTMERNTGNSLLMQWLGRPRACLLVSKQSDQILLRTLQDMAKFLISQGIIVVLEPQVLKDHPNLKETVHGVRTFSKADQLERSIDLVVTIGGDGTLTWAVSLFRGGMPPVLAFAAGSLGFLTPFPLDHWVRTLTGLLDLHCERTPQPLVCRMRLRVCIRRRGSDTEAHQVQCLNEVLVHRGASGSLVKLNVGVDGEKVTLVQGDGLILATPTGSTAYSLAAGGSMVHPAVPGILLTPVSPHSLSFRPALLPDSAVISVGVPLTARCGAAVSVDGKDLCVLKIGDSVEVAASSHPVPTICHTTETKDWFSSVQSGLQWNMRLEQKAA
jgi:NAD+ kinase